MDVMDRDYEPKDNNDVVDDDFGSAGERWLRQFTWIQFH